MIDLENAIEKLKDEIIFSGVTHEDKSLALDIDYLNLNTVLNIEFEDDDFDTILVYGTGLENILTPVLQTYLDDADLCRTVPVELFIDEMSRYGHISLNSFKVEDL